MSTLIKMISLQRSNSVLLHDLICAPSTALGGVSLSVRKSEMVDVAGTHDSGNSCHQLTKMPCIAFFVWFAVAPLLSEIRDDIGITKQDVWTSNIVGVGGTIMMRFICKCCQAVDDIVAQWFSVSFLPMHVLSKIL